MKKTVFFLAMTLLVLASVAGAADFRGTSWGMTKSQVKEVAKKNGSRHTRYSDTKLIFTAWHSVGDIVVSYEFMDGKLVCGEFTVHEPYSPRQHVRAYEQLGMQLRQQHGPGDFEEVWKLSGHGQGPTSHESGVLSGQLVLKTSWDQDGTLIEHRLENVNFKLKHSVRYSDKKRIKKYLSQK